MKRISTVFWAILFCAGPEAVRAEGYTVFGLPARKADPELTRQVTEEIIPPSVLNLRLGMGESEYLPLKPGTDKTGMKIPLGKRFNEPLGDAKLFPMFSLIEGSNGVHFFELDAQLSLSTTPTPPTDVSTVLNLYDWLLATFGNPSVAYSRENDSAAPGNEYLESQWNFEAEGAQILLTFFHVKGDFRRILKISSEPKKSHFPSISRKNAFIAPEEARDFYAAWLRDVAKLPETSAEASAPSPQLEYETLLGEDLMGAGFHFQAGSKRYIACTLHQFDGAQPKTMAHLDFDEAIRISGRVYQGRDVQVLSYVSPELDEYDPLPYDPKILPAKGGQVFFIVDGAQHHGVIREALDERTFSVLALQPFSAGGASGSPVISKDSGTVIGVLTGADNAESARQVSFEILRPGGGAEVVE